VPPERARPEGRVCERPVGRWLPWACRRRDRGPGLTLGAQNVSGAARRGTERLAAGNYTRTAGGICRCALEDGASRTARAGGDRALRQRDEGGRTAATSTLLRGFRRNAEDGQERAGRPLGSFLKRVGARRADGTVAVGVGP